MFFNSNLPITSYHNILRIRSGYQIHSIIKRVLEFSNFAPLFNMFRCLFLECFEGIKSFENYFDEQKNFYLRFCHTRYFVFLLRKYFQRSN